MTAAPVIDEAAQQAAAPEYVQPADVVDPESTGQVELFVSGFGALTLRPDQQDFTPVQRAALAAIGIDVKNDRDVEPHIVPFLHLCQSRGLDPWKREAYLIGRGEGDKRKYVMQVGIDGYLNMAKGTGRYSRVAERLWTGADDDEKSWRAVEKPNGDIVMRRVWWEAWPEDRGNPGQAKAVIEHYDDHGRLTETGAVANWGMYAPYFPATKWEQDRGGRWKKVKVYGADRKPVMELGEFWQKDPSGMLVKCATALAVRLAFPGATAGTYTTEEMHQADAVERARVEAEQAAARHQAVIDLAARKPVADSSPSEPMGWNNVVARAQAAAKVPPTGKAAAVVADVVDAELVEPQGAAPQPVGEVAAEVVGQLAPEASEEPQAPGEDWSVPPLDEATARETLLDELATQARLVGSTVPALTRRWVATHKRNADDPRTTADELQELVNSFRPMVLLMMRRNPQLAAAADVYAQVGPGQTGPISVLFGGHLPDAP